MRAAKLASLALLAGNNPQCQQHLQFHPFLHARIGFNSLPQWYDLLPGYWHAVIYGTHSPEPSTGMEWLSFEMEQFPP